MSAQKLNLMIINKTKCLELIDALTEDRNKINDNKMLEIEKNRKNDRNCIKRI